MVNYMYVPQARKEQDLPVGTCMCGSAQECGCGHLSMAGVLWQFINEDVDM